jgi:hypothetical protein
MSTNKRNKTPKLGSNDCVKIQRRFKYKFGTQGGAIGTVTLPGADGNAERLPPGAIVTSVVREVKVAAASGGSATVAVGTSASGAAFDAASAYTDNDLDTVDTVVQLTAALPRKVGASGEDVTVTIATAALTAGEHDYIVEYIPPNAGPAYVQAR